MRNTSGKRLIRFNFNLNIHFGAVVIKKWQCWTNAIVTMTMVLATVHQLGVCQNKTSLCEIRVLCRAAAIKLLLLLIFKEHEHISKKEPCKHTQTHAHTEYRKEFRPVDVDIDRNWQVKKICIISLCSFSNDDAIRISLLWVSIST